MACDPHARFVPHVIDRHLRVGEVRPVCQIPGFVNQSGELLVRGRAFPAAAGAAHPRHVKPAEMVERAFGGKPSARPGLGVHQQQARFPARQGQTRLDLGLGHCERRQRRGPKVFAFGFPTGDSLPTVKDRVFARGRLDAETGVRRFQEQPDIEVLAAVNDDRSRFAGGQIARGVAGLVEGGKRCVRVAKAGEQNRRERRGTPLPGPIRRQPKLPKRHAWRWRGHQATTGWRAGLDGDGMQGMRS